VAARQHSCTIAGSCNRSALPRPPRGPPAGSCSDRSATACQPRHDGSSHQLRRAHSAHVCSARSPSRLTRLWRSRRTPPASCPWALVRPALRPDPCLKPYQHTCTWQRCLPLSAVCSFSHASTASRCRRCRHPSQSCGNPCELSKPPRPPTPPNTLLTSHHVALAAGLAAIAMPDGELRIRSARDAATSVSDRTHTSQITALVRGGS
jgi:hypothetical protein